MGMLLAIGIIVVFSGIIVAIIYTDNKHGE
jgi:hypothetical protein